MLRRLKLTTRDESQRTPKDSSPSTGKLQPHARRAAPSPSIGRLRYHDGASS